MTSLVAPAREFPRTTVGRMTRWDAHCRSHKVCRTRLREYAWEVFPHYCVWCLTDLTRETATMEHQKPISRGGRHCIQNLMGWSCRSDNSSRGNRLLSEWPW